MVGAGSNVAVGVGVRVDVGLSVRVAVGAVVRVGVGWLVGAASVMPVLAGVGDGVTSGSAAWQAANKAALRINNANSRKSLIVASILSIVAPVAGRDKLPSSSRRYYVPLIGFWHLPITAQDHQDIVFSA